MMGLYTKPNVMYLKSFLAVLLVNFIFFGFDSNGQVVISEVLASNSITNVASYTNNYVDWIELYNNSDNTIDIGGWFLTDDIAYPTKWSIPGFIRINPRKYEIFWADDKNLLDHTCFKLEKAGETIYLIDKDTAIIDSLCYPKLEPDISYGRLNDTSSFCLYFTEATPKSKNLDRGTEKLIFASKAKFSIIPGFYKDRFELELITRDLNSKIHYTLDGSVPSVNSTCYTGPISINKTTVVRTRVFADGKLPSKISTSTYFFDKKSKLPVISLVTNHEYIFDNKLGIYAEGDDYSPEKFESANYMKNWRRPANLEYFNEDGVCEFNISAAMKIHGRSSRNNEQKSLAIFFRKKYGSDKLNYKIFKNREHEEYRSLLLRSSGNDWGITMFKDALVHTLVDGIIDVDLQAYKPAIVYFNGIYWGIHNIREKINADYLINNHKLSSGKVDIIEIDALQKGPIAVHGNLSEYDKLIEFVNKNDISIDENYELIKSKVDVNEFINYLIIQTVIGNNDFPGSNVKCWKEKSNGSRWRWILYDTEFSFGYTSEYYRINSIQRILAPESKEVFNQPWSNLLIRKLFENKSFKDEFIQRTAVYLSTIFAKNRIQYTIDQLKGNIEPEIDRHLQKWGGIIQKASPFLITSKNKEEWESNINYVKEFAANRQGFVRKQFMQQFGIKDTVTLKIKVNDIKGGKVFLMGYQLPNGRFNGNVFSGIPIKIVAIPNEGYQFEKWKEGDYAGDCSIILDSDKKLTAVFKKI
jgi:hypothetical protein